MFNRGAGARLILLVSAAAAVVVLGASAPPAHLAHIAGSSRKIRMFMVNAYVRLNPDGTVTGAPDDASPAILIHEKSLIFLEFRTTQNKPYPFCGETSSLNSRRVRRFCGEKIVNCDFSKIPFHTELIRVFAILERTDLRRRTVGENKKKNSNEQERQFFDEFGARRRNRFLWLTNAEELLRNWREKSPLVSRLCRVSLDIRILQHVYCIVLLTYELSCKIVYFSSEVMYNIFVSFYVVRRVRS
ncbi:unnamed protein product, partial [Nesidiocoris tenuis]